jgi:hypothetical protein
MTNPTFGLPSPTLPMSDPKTGKMASIWYQWVARISQLTAERPFAVVTVGASPFTFTASTIGHIILQGGTVSSIVLERSGVQINCQENQFVPMAANDTVTLAYSVAPVMIFVPSARA